MNQIQMMPSKCHMKVASGRKVDGAIRSLVMLWVKSKNFIAY